MADSFKTEVINKPKAHAQLNTVLALLKSFKLVECITLLNNCLALVGIALLFTERLKLLGLLVLATGLIVMYFAIRIRIDITLFERWDSLDVVALDEVLAKLNPKHQIGRTLEVRLIGSYRLFKQGLLVMLVQSALLILLVWFFER